MNKAEQEVKSLANFKIWWEENYKELGVDTIDSDYACTARAAWLCQNKKLVDNVDTFNSNMKNITGELTMALNILTECPIDIFAQDAKEFILKYKNAYAELQNSSTENIGNNNE